jgi:hypothetical protein
MYTFLNERLALLEEVTGQQDNTGCAVSDFCIL